MEHAHHHHHHTPEYEGTNKAFVIGIVLNALFVLVEFLVGFHYNSLALMSDAGHNLSDVASLGLSLFAFRLTKLRSSDRFTYGFHKSTILASLANAVILLIAVGSIGWEAIQRFRHPVATEGGVIAIVAGIGIVINSASAFFFFRNKDKDLNVKGAYLHLLVDALVSAGVVVAGLAISYTGLLWIDPLISIVIMAIVIMSTWSLLVESLHLSLDAVPRNIDFNKIKDTISKAKGVCGVHHIHIWGMSTTKNAMTAHLVVEEKLNADEIGAMKNSLKHSLEHLNVHHVTFETESVKCSNEECNDTNGIQY